MSEGKFRIYLDTSAYLAALLGDAKGASIRRVTQGKILCSSVLLLIEAERNLIRLSREGKISLKEYHLSYSKMEDEKNIFILRDVTEDLCLNGEFPPVRLPKSSDLIHLRSARWFQRNDGLHGFVTLDHAQREAALEFKIPVIEI